MLVMLLICLALDPLPQPLWPLPQPQWSAEAAPLAPRPTITDYPTAYAAAGQAGTLVVLLTSAGCAPCATLKTTIQELLAAGELPGVPVAEVRADLDPQFAALVAGGPVRMVPQLYVFRRDRAGQLLRADHHTGPAERVQLIRILKGA
ncbi:MAG: glutaredoxin family protein [Planctomycetota bacterium]